MYPVKLNEIQAAKQSCRVDEAALLVSTPGRFERALRSDRSVNIIAELKPASPTGGQLAPASLAGDISRHYQREAAALSVLTDRHYFDGSYELLEQVAGTSELPVLCKDFVIDPYQILRARAAGAAAVLLVVRILSDSQLRSLSALVSEYGMTPVIEIQNEQDLLRAEKIAPNVILINNRDLETLAIDLGTTARLAPLVPAGTVVISASGIKSPADIGVLRPFASNFLIGSALMASDDPAQLLRSLKGENPVDPAGCSVAAPRIACGSAALQDVSEKILQGQAERSGKVAVKVCGVCSLRDAVAAVEYGASFVGLIFVDSSRRKVDLNEASAICTSLRGKAGIVGVFQDAPLSYVNEMVAKLQLAYVQLHGEETPHYCRLVNCRVIKAFSVDRHSDPELTAPYDGIVSMYLFDRPKDRSADPAWRNELLEFLSRRKASTTPYFVAGGLNELNVREVLELVSPNAVDVASGIESHAGVKEHEKMRRFIEEVRNND